MAALGLRNNPLDITRNSSHVNISNTYKDSVIYISNFIKVILINYYYVISMRNEVPLGTYKII